MSQIIPEPTPEAAQQATETAAENLMEEQVTEPEPELQPEAVPESTLLNRFSQLEQKLDRLLGDDPEELVLTTPAANPETVTETAPNSQQNENPADRGEVETNPQPDNPQPENKRRGLFGRR